MKLSLSASPLSLLLSLAIFPQSATTQTVHVTRLPGSQTSIVTRTSISSTDTITQADCGKLISYFNSGGIAVTLPAAPSLLSGCWMDVENTGVGTVTITPSASTIDGASTITLTTNHGIRIVDATTQYLTERGQGSEGGGVSYSADGTSLSLTGTTFSANTAVLASRVTNAQAVDTTCVVPTGGSSSAYSGAMLGNAYTSGYAEGMRVLVEIPTTSSGGAITLDCGSGAKSVFQQDGVSNPTAAQWVAGQQMLLAYGGALNSGGGAWRMLNALVTNTSTADSLSGTPTLCSSGHAPTGILANGNATGCQVIPSGGGSSAITSTLVLPMSGTGIGGGGYLWDMTNVVPINAGTTIFGLGFGNLGSPYATATFQWPSNWDNTQPVNVILNWFTPGYADTLTFGVDVSFACLNAAQTNPYVGGPVVYSPVTAITFASSYTGYHTALVSAVSVGAGANLCAATQGGIIKIARDNTIASNSVNGLGIIGVGIQWTSH